METREVKNGMFDNLLAESRDGDSELTDVHEVADDLFLLHFKDQSIFLVEVRKIR